MGNSPVATVCERLWARAYFIACVLSMACLAFALNDRYLYCGMAGIAASVSVGIAIGAALIERRFR